MNKLHVFIRLPNRLYTLLLVIVFRIIILFIPFSKIATTLSKPGTTRDTIQIEYLLDIRNDLASVNKYFAPITNCLALAAAGMVICRQNGIPATLYLGASRSGNSFKAHAWLKFGQVFLCGYKGHQQFTPVKLFSWDGAIDP